MRPPWNRLRRGPTSIVDMAGVSDVQPFQREAASGQRPGDVQRLRGRPRGRRATGGFTQARTTSFGYYPAGQVIDEIVPLRPDSMYGVTSALPRPRAAYTRTRPACRWSACGSASFRTGRRTSATWRSGSVRATWPGWSGAPSRPRGSGSRSSTGSRTIPALVGSHRARTVLGYAPQDDAEAFAAELLKGPSSDLLGRIQWQGGIKLDLPFMP